MPSFDQLDLNPDGDGTLLPVKVVPGASRDRVVGVLGGALKIQTAAAPEKGRANKTVIAILAKSLGLSPREIQLVRGQTSPRKLFRIAGLSPEKLPGALRGDAARSSKIQETRYKGKGRKE